MPGYKSNRKTGFSQRYLHSFSRGISGAYQSSLDMIGSACRYSTGFLNRRKLPLALASIPVGVALAASRCDGLEQIGYTTIGGGMIEILTEIGGRQALKRTERFRKEEIKRIKKIENENENLKKELMEMKRELHRIRKLEEMEMEMLGGKS